MEPVAIVLVDALAANLDLNRANKVVADPVEPAELGTRAVRRLESDLGECGLEIHAVDQVAVALDRARNALAEARRAVEGVLDRLHREVRVAAVNHLEERNLGIAREVDILSAISNKLHQATTRHLFIPFSQK